MKKTSYLLVLLFAYVLSYGQDTIDAEIDTLFNYQFKSLKGTHYKKILFDEAHNTIYSKPSGKITAREMFRIIDADGFNIEFTKNKLDATYLDLVKPDLLILHGMPNDKIILKNGEFEEVLYKSPLKNEEVEAIGKYVFNGGSLFLFLSHFPNGSGALPLLEAFSVKFRDGYAYQNQYHTSESGKCGHFLMNDKNNMLNSSHDMFKASLDKTITPKNIRFYCGAAVFRNPEDNILSFPKNTINYTPTTNSSIDIEEQSNSYAGMLGFIYGAGRVIVCTDQGLFRSLNLIIKGKKVPVTIHDPKADNASLLLNSIRWLSKLQ
ncbi:hypothetical protein [Ichthyenterobacterium magnum]|uniref:DUF4350 domain-containing protein n=1 Tax=Ichthyenterobacterium magnum TaxID=1230530 RepID=A0A420DKU6_9FLAO|nr:hypothetical protein [Ichthyenterobacterium magnum]RKE94811.1 hypothetical protein BXY80_1824 [Ichthyenterobacterium magnum]